MLISVIKMSFFCRNYLSVYILHTCIFTDKHYFIKKLFTVIIKCRAIYNKIIGQYVKAF